MANSKNDSNESQPDSGEQADTSTNEAQSEASNFTGLRLLARSLAAKEFIAEQLEGVVHVPTPQYEHYQHSSNQIKRGTNNRSCDQEDAFAGMLIDGEGGNAWSPPGGFPLDSVQKWHQEYKLAMRRINKVSVGGDQLREVAKEEVKRLRALRHRLFCGEPI